MPQEPIEVLREAYAAVNAGDLESVLDHAADDFEIRRAMPGPPVRGKGAVKAFVAPEAFSEQSFDPVEFRANGDIVFVWLMVRVKGRGSEIELAQHVAHVWEFQEGLASSLTISFDREEALELAGLAE